MVTDDCRRLDIRTIFIADADVKFRCGYLRMRMSDGHPHTSQLVMGRTLSVTSLVVTYLCLHALHNYVTFQFVIKSGGQLHHSISMHQSGWLKLMQISVSHSMSDAVSRAYLTHGFLCKKMHQHFCECTGNSIDCLRIIKYIVDSNCRLFKSNQKGLIAVFQKCY